MEAIKKKMQAMKVEKDNACDQADVSEEKMKAARIRAQKGEDEVAELELKSRQLETELDITAERLSIATLQLEEKEKQLAATELEEISSTFNIDEQRIEFHPFFDHFIDKVGERGVTANDVLTRLGRPGPMKVDMGLYVKVTHEFPTWARDENAFADAFSVCSQKRVPERMCARSLHTTIP